MQITNSLRKNTYTIDIDHVSLFDEDTFGDVEGIKLVKFGPIWSGKYFLCDAIIRQLAECGYNVYYADTDTMDPAANRKLIQDYSITDIPTYILFDGTEELARYDKDTTFTQLKKELAVNIKTKRLKTLEAANAESASE